MTTELHAINTVPLVAAVAIAAGKGVGHDGGLAVGPQDLVGVNKFAAAAGEPCTLQHGKVSVVVSGAVTADGPIMVDAANPGQFKAAANTNQANGYTLETVTGAGTVRAIILPAPFTAVVA
jgi:hypothetical protein